jgi:hypothetical protein
MTQVPDIMVMANIKLVSFLYNEYQPIEKDLVTIKLDVLKILGYEASEHDLSVIETDFANTHNTKSRLPKKGHYINAFIDMGFTHAKIGEWFDMTPAAVSWHKMNPPKSVYAHKYLNYLRMLASGQLKEPYRDNGNL